MRGLKIQDRSCYGAAARGSLRDGFRSRPEPAAARGPPAGAEERFGGSLPLFASALTFATPPLRQGQFRSSPLGCAAAFRVGRVAFLKTNFKIPILKNVHAGPGI